MKKQIILQLLLSISLLAEITLSKEDEKNWNLQAAVGKEVSFVPIGEYMTTITVPPNLLHTMSVPYEAQVVQLNKTNFEKVKRGDTLALLTASEWIEAQREVIANTIELIHNEHLAQRNTKLCEEEIIAQKECAKIDAEVKSNRIKLLASKTLLKAYGANQSMIETLQEKLTIFPNVELKSPVNGSLLNVNIQPGKSISPSSALFVIKTDGANWLESSLPRSAASKLSSSKEIIITIDEKDIKSKLLHMSPVLDPLNQTRYTRFSLPQDSELLAGLRTKAKISIKQKAFLVNKKSVVQDRNKTVVFIKKGELYKAEEVEVIFEDKDRCYLAYNAALHEPIVVGATSILQNMLQKGD
ncbi:efflux RND transporter periplasmic adaptor subunit [Sulfurimonas sp.]|uniref:efflux RND transporter periplasmic adaptor subunit n=1 Tax=Sulfurimonas sp. TaxID=2022749 RepID=UPI0025D2B49F|nr:efflux RND transporter periplasmic adaptor subunit [Sulfurimonas sp.]MCK9453544.1 efflux RND transporter periplasmic adaptor subunit [Sulfurimonas sp.]